MAWLSGECLGGNERVQIFRPTWNPEGTFEMNINLTSVTVLVALLTAQAVGTWIRRLLPEHHLSAESKDTIKLAMGLVGTMTALVLGLLVSSAKSSYDTTRGEVLQMAAKVSLIDRIFAVYGPEATQVREQFRELMKGTIRKMWPDARDQPADLGMNNQGGGALYFAIETLSAKDEGQRSLKAQAASQVVELAQLRSLLMAQSTPSISKPMLVIVISWLVVIFLSFSLLSPSNVTANLALVIAAISVSGAIFLILELDRPFGGMVRISSDPMVNVLREDGK